MPWITPNPTVEKVDSWRFPGPTGTHKVSLWPRPNSARVNCRFRIKHTRPVLIPVAARYGVYFRRSLLDYDPDDVEFNGCGVYEFEVRGDHHIGLTTEQHPQGYVADINIKGLDVLPRNGGNGVQYNVILTHPTLGTLEQDEEWFQPEVAQPWRHDMNTQVYNSSIGRVFLGVPPSWTTLVKLECFAVSDCYDFDLPEPPGAEFNGVDAFIDLQFSTGVDSGPFSVSMDMVLRGADPHPILGFAAGNSAYQIIGGDLFWGPVNIAQGIFPALGVPFNLRTEFEWTLGAQLTYQTFIDNVLVAQTTTNRQNFNVGQLGKRNQNVPAVFGHFDMKNLFWQRGTFAEPIVELDMPLLVNAIDNGPKGNDGTTFNMALPSV